MIDSGVKQPLRPLWIIAAVAITSLVLIPLFGLFAGLIDPPQTPFTVHTHFFDLLRQNGLFRLLWTTVFLSLLVSVLASAIGICLAWLERRTVYPGGKWLAILALLPLAMPSYLLAATLRESLAPNSMLGGFLGTPIFRGFFPTVIVLTLVTVPYVQLLVSSTLFSKSFIFSLNGFNI